MAVVIFPPFLLELPASSCVCGVAVERHVLVKKRFQCDLHLLLRLIAIKGGFDLAEDCVED